MAEAQRRANSALIEQLLSRGYEFDFFQAVRLLEHLAREERDRSGLAALAPVGLGNTPRNEPIRFRAPPTLSFAPSAIHEIRATAGKGDGKLAWPVEMTISFLGLVGPSGVLPHHYSSQVIERTSAGDHALREFLEMFQHRATSFFFQAWQKYRFPFAYESYLAEKKSAEGRSGAPQERDLFTFCLTCLPGLGTAGLANRLSVDDQAIVYYSGHYSHQPRSAVGLEGVLSDYFGVPARVEQFRGRWINLPPDQRTSLPTAQNPRGLNCVLGQGAIAGARIWNVNSLFRIRLGPVDYRTFESFMPSGLAMRRLCDLVRLYVGPELDFEVQPVLKKEEVPLTQLRGAGQGPSRLGWNTWLRSRPLPQDGEKAVFRSLDA